MMIFFGRKHKIKKKNRRFLLVAITVVGLAVNTEEDYVYVYVSSA